MSAWEQGCLLLFPDKPSLPFPRASTPNFASGESSVLPRPDAHPGPIPRLNQSRSYRQHTPSALACALSLHLDMLLIRPAANVLAAPSTDNIGCSRRVNGWLFVSPFNRRKRACLRGEAQVNAHACLIELQPTWLTLLRLFAMKFDFRHFP
jgi:hypothetical protein